MDKKLLQEKPESYYKFKRDEVAAFLPENYKNVLEIGCGAGSFRSNLSLECEYWGVEMDHDSAELAEKNLDRVFNSTYEDAYNHLPDGYFDLIICNDVIEHMPDHDYFFDSIKRKMSENASITGSIPNVRYIRNLFGILIRKDWKYKDQGILDRTHLRFFTLKSLKRTFSEHGFVIEKSWGLNCIWKKNKLIKSIPNFIIYFVPALILGLDVKYKQFGFRIKTE